jgi:hypothetical protein
VNCEEGDGGDGRYFSTRSATEPSRPMARIFTQRPLASYQTSRRRRAGS